MQKMADMITAIEDIKECILAFKMKYDDDYGSTVLEGRQHRILKYVLEAIQNE